MPDPPGPGREITLLGQNVNAFGHDKSGDGVSFAQLLAQVAALPGLERLRFVTPHPKDMGLEDVAAFAELAPLCPRLHLPLQAGSDAVLTRMRRRYDRRGWNWWTACATLRPDLALSTDLIVGFPGESEEDFQATLEMMEACGFMSSFSFCYSDRPGARAALFPDKIPPEVQQERLLRFRPAGSAQPALAGRPRGPGNLPAHRGQKPQGWPGRGKQLAGARSLRRVGPCGPAAGGGPYRAHGAGAHHRGQEAQPHGPTGG